MEINSTFDAKVNSVVDLEIDNKERWDDVDLDEDITDEEVDMEIDSTFDAKVNSVIDLEVNNKEYENNVESDEESMHTAECHDDKYAEYDSDNKYTEHDLNMVQSTKVQNNDIPTDMTDMMVEQYEEEENLPPMC